MIIVYSQLFILFLSFVANHKIFIGQVLFSQLDVLSKTKKQADRLMAKSVIAFIREMQVAEKVVMQTMMEFSKTVVIRDRHNITLETSTRDIEALLGKGKIVVFATALSQVRDKVSAGVKCASKEKNSQGALFIVKFQ